MATKNDDDENLDHGRLRLDLPADRGRRKSSIQAPLVGHDSEWSSAVRAVRRRGILAAGSRGEQKQRLFSEFDASGLAKS